MVPILVSQAAIMGMSFFDASMSGHAGNNDLAGASVEIPYLRFWLV